MIWSNRNGRFGDHFTVGDHFGGCTDLYKVKLRLFDTVLLAGFLITIIKAKSTAIVFFSSPPFLLLALSFLLSFSFVTVTPFTQMTANFVRLVFKKSNRLT